MSSQSSAGRSVSPGKNLTRIGSKGKGFIWRENWYNRPRSWRCFRASAWDWTKASIVYLTIRVGLLHPRAKMLCLIQHGFILYHKFFSTDWCIGLKWVKGQGAAASASATTKDCPNGNATVLIPNDQLSLVHFQNAPDDSIVFHPWCMWVSNVPFFSKRSLICK